MSTSPRLFHSVLGEAYASLPPALRALHAGSGRWRGEAVVERGQGLLSRLCVWLTQLPPAGAHPVDVEIVARHDGEHWIRRYGGSHAMPSRLWMAGGALCERLGPVTLHYRLTIEDAAIVWRVAGIRILDLLPLPGRWFAGVVARESDGDGRYRFDVRAQLPVVGLLVHYRGWLQPA
jgi:Domain of unknown function (DUF4166)